jgi:hypothetical protein
MSFFQSPSFMLQLKENLFANDGRACTIRSADARHPHLQVAFARREPALFVLSASLS